MKQHADFVYQQNNHTKLLDQEIRKRDARINHSVRFRDQVVKDEEQALKLFEGR